MVDDDDEYAVVHGKGAQLSASSDCSETESTSKARKEVSSVSYDYIGEDSYLMSSDRKVCTEDGAEVETALSDQKYSKITSSVGVKILEGDCGELRHLTDVPPPSNTTAVDVSLLYAKVNKRKKKTGSNEGKLTTEDGGYREVSSSPGGGHSIDKEEPKASGIGNVSQSEKMGGDYSSVEEKPGGVITVDDLVSMEMIVASMQNSLKDEQGGPMKGPGGVAGIVPEGAKGRGERERISADMTVKAEMENGYHNVVTDIDDDNFYVNIDL